MGSKGPDAPKQDKKPLDDSKTKPSVRGTLAPYVLGTIRVGPIFGAVFGRTTYEVQISEGGGGGGGKGGGPPEPEPQLETRYREKGWHIISIGKGRSIRVIDTDGVATGEITRASFPSGSTVSANALGSFKVYWGEDSQPVNNSLSNFLGVASTWPHMFYLVWEPRELGTSATWPSQEFEIEVETQFDTVGGKPAYIRTNGYEETDISMTHADSSDPFFYTTDTRAADFRAGYVLSNASIGYEATIQKVEVNGPGWDVYTEIFAPFTGTNGDYQVTGKAKSGVNPAAALWQMLFEPYPFGLGWSQALFELSDFTTLAELFAEDGDEPYPCTLNLSAGKSFKDGIGMVMEDAGIGWWKDSTTGKYRFSAIREQADTFEITASQYSASDLDLSYDYATLAPKSTVYAFDDRNRKFTRSTIRESDDGAYQFSEDPNTAKVDLVTATDYSTASIIASRRSQEKTDQEEIPLNLPRELIDIDMNGLYPIEGLPGKYRVKTKNYDLGSGTVKSTFIKDVYSINNQFVEIDQDIIQAGLLGPYPDPQVGIFEPSRMVNIDKNGVLVTKTRAHSLITTSDLTMSPDNTTYTTVVGSGGYCTGGKLLDDLPDTDPVLIETGPVISNVGPDILNVADLSSSEELWRTGSQICIINGEVFYLRNMTVISEGQYRLEGLIRARAGTSIGDHAAGDDVYIMPSNLFVASKPTFLVNGSTVYVKTLPRTSRGRIDSDDVTPVSLTYQGGGYRPLPASNLNTTNMSKHWIAGQDASLRWSYKNGIAETGAGRLLPGEVGVPATFEGTFTLIITDGVDIKRTESGLTDPNYTYSNADIVSDFGVEPPSFNAIVISELNGLTSTQVEVTITKY